MSRFNWQCICTWSALRLVKAPVKMNQVTGWGKQGAHDPAAAQRHADDGGGC